MKKLILFFTMLLILISCSSFISKEVELDLRQKYEGKLYKMKKNLFLNNKNVLKKGETVKLILNIFNSRTAESNVKVYVYKYENDESVLKSDRYLLVYLFSDDFVIKDEDNSEEKDKETEQEKMNKNLLNSNSALGENQPVSKPEKYDQDGFLNELDIRIKEYVTQK